MLETQTRGIGNNADKKMIMIVSMIQLDNLSPKTEPEWLDTDTDGVVINADSDDHRHDRWRHKILPTLTPRYFKEWLEY